MCFFLPPQTWLAEAGGRGDTLRYKTHTFSNNNGAHDVHRYQLEEAVCVCLAR